MPRQFRAQDCSHETLRVAVIGAGRLGGFHAQKLVGLPHVELVAVVDPDADPPQPPGRRVQHGGPGRPPAAAGQDRRRGDRRAHRLHHPTRPGIPGGQDPPAGREAAVRQRRPRPTSWSPRPGGSTVVLQVGHVERFNPALAAAAPHLRNPRYIEAVRASGFTFRSLDVGVVLDLMIHDIDLVLSLVRSPLRQGRGPGAVGPRRPRGRGQRPAGVRVRLRGRALGLAGEPTSRPGACRSGRPRALANIDFATRTTTLVRPSETLLRRQFHAEDFTPEQVEYYREHLAEEHLPREQKRFEAVDALALELQDFVEAVLTPREPRVGGEAGRDAVAVAEQILERIALPRLATTAAEMPAAPSAPHVRIIPAPHFDLSALDRPAAERKAG